MGGGLLHAFFLFPAFFPWSMVDKFFIPHLQMQKNHSSRPLPDNVGYQRTDQYKVILYP